MTNFDPSATPDDAFWKRLEDEVRMYARIIAGAYGIPPQDSDVIAQIVLAALWAALCKALREGRGLPDDLSKYVKQTVRHECIHRLGWENPEMRRVRDAVLDTLKGKRSIRGLKVWVQHGRLIGGAVDWDGQPVRETAGLRKLRQGRADFVSFADPRGGIDHVPTLVTLVFDYVGGPVEVGELVQIIARIQGVDRAPPLSLDDPPPDGMSPLDVASGEPTPEDVVLREEEIKAMVAAYALAMISLSRQRLGSVLFGLTPDEVNAIEWACREQQSWVRQFDPWLQRHFAEGDLQELRHSPVLIRTLAELYARILKMKVRQLKAALARVKWPDTEIAAWLGISVNAVKVSRCEAWIRLRVMVRELFSDSRAK